jgi:glycosyltransferase involved in cell wall biosynthesis
MSILLSHPTGNTFVRNALIALKQENRLREFVTTVATFESNAFGTLSKLPGGSELARRAYPESIQDLTHQAPLNELIRMIAPKIGLSALTRHETGAFCVDKIYQEIDRVAAKRTHALSPNLQATYCYEDGALETFKAAQELHLKRIYDLPIGYWRMAGKIQREEAERRPEWASTMPALQDSETKLARKDEELQMTDAIIVASQFTASTLKAAPFELPTPYIVPYGCPKVQIDQPEVSDPSKVLKVLYVGGLSQRKGLSYLLDAVVPLGSSVELTLIGKRVADCKPLDAALQSYNWIESLPHHEILSTMRAHDVLVFPSLFEGFGLVLTEALSQGVPIISTPHTCAPDLITDGKEGFIVPICDANAITDCLTRLSEDRVLLQRMKCQALETARAHTWENYRNGIIAATHAILKKPNLPES